MMPLGTGVLDGTPTGGRAGRVGTRTGGSESGDGGDGNEGVDIEMVSETCVRSPSWLARMHRGRLI